MNPPAAGIHHPGKPHDPDQPIGSKVLAIEHSTADLVEQLNVTLLPQTPRVAAKVREDTVHDQSEASHLPLERVVAAVRPERSAPEVSQDLFENLSAIAVSG
jgi:hypothetical protein